MTPFSIASDRRAARAAPGNGAGQAGRGRAWWAARRPAVRHAAVLLGYLVLGVATTWPRITYLFAARLPNSQDEATSAWDMWWLARQVTHLGNPFSTHQLLAPAGAPLGYHALMPLAGLVLTPVTLVAGPVFSVNLLTAVLPGLACYAMYRAARLWLPGPGAPAAGVFFGLSSMLTWRAWFHLNIAAGAVFLPVALEAATRLRRAPSYRRAAVLGLVLGLTVLVDVESAVLAVIVAAAALASWLRGQAGPARLRPLLLAAGVAAAVASPQLVAMAQQSAALSSSPNLLAWSYQAYGVALPQLFAPSPRVAAFGLTGLGRVFYQGIATEGMPTFGVTLTLLAVLGAALTWRQARTRLWLALWLAACLVALGPVLYLGRHAYVPLAVGDHGYRQSAVMPYTWLVHLPGLAGFREANRFTPLGLLPAALLAGTATARIRAWFAPALLLVAALAAVELGWTAPRPADVIAPWITATIPARLAAVDQGIAADRSGSVVVDVPLGFRSGLGSLGFPFPAEELVLATLDGHPRAIGKISRVPPRTLAALARHPFYADIMALQAGRPVPAAGVPAAAADARQMNVGWVLVWGPVSPGLGQFLAGTGFTYGYHADGVTAYRGAG